MRGMIMGMGKLFVMTVFIKKITQILPRKNKLTKTYISPRE